MPNVMPDDPIKSLRGIIQGRKSMAQELLEERRRDNLREQNGIFDAKRFYKISNEN